MAWLTNLSPEDLFVLLGKIRHIYASGDAKRYLIQDEGIQAFMAHCSKRIGEAYFRTPRNTITAFINLLAVLDQNPEVQLSDLIRQVTLQPEMSPDTMPKGLELPDLDLSENPTDDLATFKL
jgi:hypothetical protein